MVKANHLKPTHTGGTTSITTRRKPTREQATLCVPRIPSTALTSRVAVPAA